jgi:aminoglycoside phosphotransferase (APT) family kinase protein
MAVSGSTHDLGAVRAGLLRWFAEHDRAADDVTLQPSSEGLSSETLFVDVSRGDTVEQLVVRLPPAGEGLFPAYDLALQARLQGAMPGFGVPTAAVAACEDDASWVGVPFLLMPRVPGELLANNPHYSRSGWLKDAGFEAQRRLYTRFLDVLARIHAVDPAAVGMPVGEGLAEEIGRWEAYVGWAGADEVGPALAWCAAHRPEPEPAPSVLWGDVRLGNVIFDRGDVAAVLDWEMATVGPAEVDLGWFFALRELSLRPGAVELPGFLDKGSSLERYEAALGRPVADLRWYEAFALVRSTAVLIRTQRLLVAQGRSDHWLVGFDPVPPALRSLA